MKIFKKYFWAGFVVCVMVLFTVLGINQAQRREWEQLQSEIKISAEETIQTFKEAGLYIENIKNVTKVSKAKYGEPRFVLSFELMQEKLFYVAVYEYQDWKDASDTVEYQIDFRKSNLIDYKGVFFSYGTVMVHINPPNENLEAQLKKILMDRYNLTKQGAETK